jgi:hypothetical protein
MDESLVDKGVEKGVGVVGGRLGEMGARQVRRAVRDVRQYGGVGRWAKEKPAQLISLLALTAAAGYVAWAYRERD